MTADQHENQTVFSLTPQLIPVFASILGEPSEQLDDETRAAVVQTVKFIHSKQASVVQGHETLVAAVRS